MDAAHMRQLLGGPHQAVLAVSRSGRGPVAVPISYHYAAGSFFMVTSPRSLHGRLMAHAGRATMTIHSERYGERDVHQWYVMAEGPVRFTDLDPQPYARRILVKDRGEVDVDQWRAAQPGSNDRVAVLEPDRISGYEFHDSVGE